jgi:hypothetical protein
MWYTRNMYNFQDSSQKAPLPLLSRTVRNLYNYKQDGRCQTYTIWPQCLHKDSPCYRCRQPGQRSRYSAWLQAGQPRGRISNPGMVKNFLFSTSSRPALGSTQPPIQWVPGPLYLGVKRQGCEADHSPPASAEVKKMWIYTSTPPYTFMSKCLNS